MSGFAYLLVCSRVRVFWKDLGMGDNAGGNGGAEEKGGKLTHLPVQGNHAENHHLISRVLRF